ncbi:MAG TPA: phenylalanine--tRNA ligase subunit alpha [Gaiellaceae bacterium]|nr:phenylalanine--tRNA ligase subunit alpha [Gaiellaceae bacterium]
MDSLAAMQSNGTDWTAYQEEALAAIAAALSEQELDDARVRFLGRKSDLAQALRGVRDRESGMLLNGVRSKLEEAVAAREAELVRLAYELAAEAGVDVTIPGTPVTRGRLHLLTQIRREIEDIFLGMGYEVWDGNEVATVWENFDALTSDPGHPSRSQFDTFYIDANTVLRTHTSPDQIRAMQTRKPPIYMVSPGRCYRRDTPDATHSPIFLQVECLAVDRGITLADLQGTVLKFFRALFGDEREVRMRTSFFPFTEPSVEFDVTCFICGGQGCATCKHSGWIEMGGAGWVDPDVFRNVGIDPDEYQGFAFGFGIERIAMLRHGLPDLRAFWENDLRVLGQF